MEKPKVFISYSWDNDLHKDWIVMLTNNLRKQGIYANFDRGVNQKGTINLNRMMIENLRDNDFIIVVMTRNYKERADEYKGGVGLETMLLGNEILSNTHKVIPLKRDQGVDNEIVPYYLNGLNYTDFSQDGNFEESFNELLHRILKVDQLELDPIGELPNLKPKKIEYKPSNKVIVDDNKLQSIIEWMIVNNKSIKKLISIKSSHKEIIEFFYSAIVSSNDQLKRENVKSFMEYIFYLKKQRFNSDYFKDELEEVLQINEVAAIIMDQREWNIKLLFNDEQTIKMFCKTLISFYSNKINNFNGNFHIYGNCVEHLCKYYEIFQNLFEYENEFLNVLRYAICKSGNSSDTGYDFDGIDKVRKNISLLDEKFVLKLLEQFEAKRIYVDDIISRQLIAIIEGYYKNEVNDDLKKRLKFVYVDCKYIETLILGIIEENLEEYYEEFYHVENDINENTFSKNKIVRIIEERISEKNSDNSIKFISVIEDLSKYNIIIQINEDDVYEIISILYARGGKIVKLMCENKEVSNFPYKLGELGKRIKCNSREYRILKSKISDKLSVIRSRLDGEEEDGIIKNVPKNHNWIDE